MTVPFIPRETLLRTDEIPTDEKFGGMRIVRCQSDTGAMEAFTGNRYEFQAEQAKRHVIPGTVLAVKGSPQNPRVTAMTHLTLHQFTEIVRYDPSQPPNEDYEEMRMWKSHEQTQQDFRGAKKENLANFKQYLIESIIGDRTAYLPPVSGWQQKKFFPDTIFVAYDETNENALYGVLYLPKKPIMQSDGQTQTAALFQASRTGVAIKNGALDTFQVTLEIELNMNEDRAGQSFADRNGRGSKKNKNLVAQLDTSSALAQIRKRAIEGTIFEDRLADGRTTGATETAPGKIVDLSTMEQMLLNVMTRGTKKPEHIKHYHVEHFYPYCREFLLLLQDTFGHSWPETTPKGSETYRRLYVHGWAFALKALALAFHDVKRDKLGPLVAAMSANSKDEHSTADEAKEAYFARVRDAESQDPRISFDEFKSRLEKIDWHRYRKHWIKITGAKTDRKTGSTKTREIKDPENPGAKKVVVEGKAENTAATIGAVVAKILSDNWEELCETTDAKP
ncbi:DNA sulfur modification protein DndB [Saccharomonospora piscinae]|uniref:DNA sulfur modification protein DndB n=1 Tax=Saccharomonospora piscinae TaxID=687388 RepID=UPI00046356FE|nr:DNA sulfur modification protein DndB [Saccharomonospora piscinae]